MDTVEVEPRLLRRIIRRHRGMSGLGVRVLHERCYTLPRSELLELLTLEQLGVRELDEHPILVKRPPAGEAVPERDVFHARVHRELERRGLTPAVVKARIHAIGQTEFDEIRFVLKQDDLLLPPRDDVSTYIEFAARYLELARFAPSELPKTFPAILDHAAIRTILGRDLPPELLTDVHAHVHVHANANANANEHAHDHAHAVEGDAIRGNLAKAAIVAARAGQNPRPHLAALVARLPVADRGQWVEALVPLVRQAAATPWRRGVEARLLYDLVKAAVDLERELADVDVVEWALSLGKVPVIRPLPAAHPVRYVKHLRHALGKLPRVRLGAGERERLGELLHAEHARAAEDVRQRLRPRFEEVLDKVGLSPTNVPERVARRKLVDELLDRVVERGFLSLGHLRDALARNGLKLPDLDGPVTWWRGDPLLRADALLERAVDGVYRRGEIYMRGLQKLSSIFFATPPGRVLTLYLLLPFVVAYVVLVGLQHIVGPVTHFLGGEEPEIYTDLRCGVLTAVVFGLVHSPRLRAGVIAGARAVGRGLHAVFVAAPRAVWRSAPVAWLRHDRSVRLLGHWLLKPALVAGLLFLVARLLRLDQKVALVVGAGFFLGLNVLQATRFYALAEEVALEWTVSTFRLVGHRILPGLFRLLLDFFRGLLELVDRAMVAVDELLRFRRGEGRAALVAKGFLGTIWGAVTYFVRIYVNLLLEPTVNPIKHFPVVTVAGKIMLTIAPTILAGMTNALTPILGRVLAGSFAGATLFVLPGFWGFLVWELQENWRLYAANRPRTLRPVTVGSHGETVGRLLRPGLHSGTVPKAYHKLRRAERKGSPAAVRHHETLHHVNEAVARFVERDFIALLEESGAFPRGVLGVGGVQAASNRIRVTITKDGAPAVIAFEEQSGWIVAARPQPGWIAELPPAQRDAFEHALDGLFELAGVNLRRDDLEKRLPAGTPYDIADVGLLVWPAGDEHAFPEEVVMPLARDRRELGWSDWVRRWDAPRAVS